MSSETGCTHTTLESVRKSKTFVCLCAFSNIDSGLTALSRKTQSPARLFSSTLLLTILKSGDAFGVLLASSPLVGAFLFNALLRICQNNSSGNFSFYAIKAMVVLNAFIEIRSCCITLFGKASSPACSVISTFF
jgi:hypothetical protein